MKMRVPLFLLIVSLLVVACGAPTEPASLNPTEGPATAAVQNNPVVPTSTSEPDRLEQESPDPEEIQPVETPEADCPGEETNTIGQGIADEYDFASYEEVMTWFCSGAEFEDILVALQTEDQTGTPAEEMLVMLAEGFTWEEIWLVIGLIE
jgi:hypothetical protein